MQVHREKEDKRQAKPLREIKAHLNIAYHFLVVEGLDIYPAENLVVEKHNPQLELSP